MPVCNRQKKLRKDTGNKSVIDVRTRLCDRWRRQVRDTDGLAWERCISLLLPPPLTEEQLLD